MKLCSLVSVMVIAYAQTAYAYIGPGVGLGAIAGTLAILLGLLLLFGAIIWFPLKRRFKKNKENTEENS